MSNIIERVKIEKLFGEKDVDWKLRPDVNVLVGKNGLGKSTILKLIYATILRVNEDSYDDCCSQIEIDFQDATQCIFKTNMEFNNFLNIFKETIDFNIKNDKKMKIKFDEDAYEDISPKQAVILIRDYLDKFLDNSPKKSSDSSSKFDGNKKDLTISFISTIDMSANSVREIRKSDGISTIQLDDEIKEEIEKLERIGNEELQKNLITALNSLFEDTYKKIYFEQANIKVKLNSNKEISFENLSSGERQVIYIFLKVANATKDNALILMDEPEISLHLAWQEKLISEIRKVNDKSQLIIVTHSPAIVMNGWMDSFIDINDIFVGE